MGISSQSGCAGRLVAQNGVQNIVPVGEDVGGDCHPIADDALDGKPAAIDLRLDILDDDAVGKRPA